MDWYLVGLVLNFVVMVGTIAKILGRDSQRISSLEDRADTLARQSKEHYAHAADEDAHWTRRERKALQSDLGEMKADLKELLRRNGES